MDIITIPAFVKHEKNKRGIKLTQLSIGLTAYVRIKGNKITNDKTVEPVYIEVLGWDYVQYDKCMKMFIYINLKLKRAELPAL